MRIKILYLLFNLLFILNDCYSQIEKIEIIKSDSNNYPFFDCKKKCKDSYTGFDTTYCKHHDSSIFIKVVIKYVDGERREITGYYPSGSIYRKTHCFNGKLNGTDIRLYDNGNPELKTYYENDERTFPMISWYRNGKLEEIDDSDGNPFDSLNRGFYKIWYPNGFLKYEQEMIENTMGAYIEKIYYESGQLKEIFTPNYGKQEFKAYYEDSLPEISGFYFNMHGFSVGHWQMWHKNGKLSRDFYYTEESEPDSTWSWWDEQGNLIKQEFYKFGELIETKEYVKKKKSSEDLD